MAGGIYETNPGNIGSALDHIVGSETSDAIMDQLDQLGVFDDGVVKVQSVSDIHDLKGGEGIEVAIINGVDGPVFGDQVPSDIKAVVFDTDQNLDIYGLNNEIVVTGSGSDMVFGGSTDGQHLYSGAGDDRVYGGSGDDQFIDAGSGDDQIVGGHGTGTYNGGEGNDTIILGDQNSTVSGGEGDDHIFAGAGNDSLDGGAGNDFIQGRGGEDTISGGDGNDTIYGGGHDTISGGDGNDVIYSNGGVDSIDGGIGNDTIWADGNDTVYGGLGDDELHVSGADNHIDAGDGNDTVFLDDFGSATIDGGVGENDTLFVGGGHGEHTESTLDDGTLVLSFSDGTTLEVHGFEHILFKDQ